jgi:hypothetical protein
VAELENASGVVPLEDKTLSPFPDDAKVILLLLEPSPTFWAIAELERLTVVVPEAIATFWAVAVLERLKAAKPEAIKTFWATTLEVKSNELPPLENKVCSVPKISDSNQPWNSRLSRVKISLERRSCGLLIWVLLESLLI